MVNGLSQQSHSENFQEKNNLLIILYDLHRHVALGLRLPLPPFPYIQTTFFFYKKIELSRSFPTPNPFLVALINGSESK